MELTIREQLEELAEEKYRIFTSSLTPGKENILGVRIPLLKKMAKKLIKGDWNTLRIIPWMTLLSTRLFRKLQNPCAWIRIPRI